MSVDAFDGATREVAGQDALLFGLDKIAKLYGSNADLQPLFHHELFHCYHYDWVPEQEPPSGKAPGIIGPLWREGLAVLVAQRLNPKATWAQLVLTDEMLKVPAPVLSSLAGELAERLDPMDEASALELYRDFFRSSGKRVGIPPRMGYYLGYRVAQIVARNYEIQVLAKKSEVELRGEIEGALRELGGKEPGMSP